MSLCRGGDVVAVRFNLADLAGSNSTSGSLAGIVLSCLLIGIRCSCEAMGAA